jgi:membrane protein YqaA with SNARE-associated domain
LLAKITSALIAYGPWGVFLLGLIDSVGIPLPAAMDVLIILIAVRAPGRVYLAAGLGVIGSVIGNLILFALARYGVTRLVRMAEHPGRFHRWFHRYGLVTVFIPAAVPVLPLPLKFFVVSAGVLRGNIAHFVVIILLARTCRYFGDAFLGLTLGLNAEAFLRHNVWALVAAAIALAVSLILLFRWNERRRRPAHHRPWRPRKWR